jgi:hypothetical protein
MSTLLYPRNRLTDTLEREYARRFMLYHYHEPVALRSSPKSASNALKHAVKRWGRKLWKAIETEGQQRAAHLIAINHWY